MTKEAAAGADLNESESSRRTASLAFDNSKDRNGTWDMSLGSSD